MNVNIRQLLLYGFLSMLPGILFTLWFLFIGDYGALEWYTTLFLLVALSGALYAQFASKVAQPWNGIANMIQSLREEDYSLRLRKQDGKDPIGAAFEEINLLSDMLQKGRMNFVETHELFLQVVKRINAAIFCFDPENDLVLANPKGMELLGNEIEKPEGQSAESLGLQSLFEAEPDKAVSFDFPAKSGRWLISRGAYRQEGKPYTLVIVNDVGRPLREEELIAWHRLIRVLGHEINNSMTPLISLTDSLSKLVNKDELPEGWQTDLKEGLSIVSRRVKNLSQFIKGYSQLAKLPLPNKGQVNLKNLMQRVFSLNALPNVSLEDGEDCVLNADEAQIEQLIINVLKNAIEASNETKGSVQGGWLANKDNVTIWIQDEGTGLANTENVFVPFFTTKSTGTGIGLAISRQIVEAHLGSIKIENREDRSGCKVTVRLPIA